MAKCQVSPSLNRKFKSDSGLDKMLFSRHSILRYDSGSSLSISREVSVASKSEFNASKKLCHSAKT